MLMLQWLGALTLGFAFAPLVILLGLFYDKMLLVVDRKSGEFRSEVRFLWWQKKVVPLTEIQAVQFRHWYDRELGDCGDVTLIRTGAADKIKVYSGLGQLRMFAQALAKAMDKPLVEVL